MDINPASMPQQDPDIIEPPIDVPVYRNGAKLSAPLQVHSYRELESLKEMAAGLASTFNVDFEAVEAELTRRALDD